MLTYFNSIITRDLNKLKEELNLYSNAADMWTVLPGTSNSAGNLALHLIGNLRHFIGHELGKSGYIRNRDEEFARKDVSLAEINELINTCMQEVDAAFISVSSDVLSTEFPKEIGGQKRDTSYALLHLLSHLSYHLGQINYHRRIVSNKS